MGAHPPDPRRGACAPWTPFAHPRKLRVRRRIGSHSWRGFQSGLLAPSFGFVGGNPPTPPPWGLRPPGPPVLPTLFGLGFAKVLGPTRGGVANVGNSPSFKVLGGTSPRPPGMGLRPLHPRIKVGEGRPFSKRLTSVGVNGTPPRPRRGACAPWTPVCPPSLAEGSPGFWGVNLSPARTPPNFPPSLAGKGARGLGRKGTSTTPPVRGLCPLDPCLPALVGYWGPMAYVRGGFRLLGGLLLRVWLCLLKRSEGLLPKL